MLSNIFPVWMQRKAKYFQDFLLNRTLREKDTCSWYKCQKRQNLGLSWGSLFLYKQYAAASKEKNRNKNTFWNWKPKLLFFKKAHQNCCLQITPVLSNWLFPTGKHSCRKFPIGLQAGLCSVKVTKSGFCFCSPRISTAQLFFSQKTRFTENYYIGIESF